MKFLGNLGVDIKLLIAQVINFGLLLWLLTKFLYKPIIRRIEKDENELEQSKIQKKELEQQKYVFEEQKKKKLIDTKKRAREIIKEAENMAKEIKQRAREEAEREKRAVIKQIKSRLSKMEHAEKPK